MVSSPGAQDTVLIFLAAHMSLHRAIDWRSFTQSDEPPGLPSANAERMHRARRGST